MTSALHRPLRILFVCGKNLRRSPTAEALYRNDVRVQVRSAGVSEKSRRRVRQTDLEWADLILVMERKHAERIRHAWGDAERESLGEPMMDPAQDPPLSPLLPPIVSLEIPDDFEYMEPDLVDLLSQSVEAQLLAYDA